MLEDVIKKCQKLVKQQLKVDITEASRRRAVVSARGAVMTALVERFTAAAIARQFGKTHATVLYFKNKHEQGMIYSDYRIAYHIAYDVCEGIDVPLLDTTHKMKDLVFKQRSELDILRTQVANLNKEVETKQKTLKNSKRFEHLFYELANQLGINKETLV
jgi:hypothetical protein